MSSIKKEAEWRFLLAHLSDQFDWEIDISWYDFMGMHQPADPQLLAKIELDRQGTADSYPGFTVTILNKLTGPVDRHFFPFREYVDEWRDVRNEGKGAPKHAMPPFNMTMHLDHDRHTGLAQLTWYLVAPLETRTLCSKIENYIAEFTER